MPTDGAGRVGREHPAVLTRPTLLLMSLPVAFARKRLTAVVLARPATVATILD